LARHRLFRDCPVWHTQKLPDGLAAAFKNGNWVASISLTGNFPGRTDGVLEIIGCLKRVFGTLVYNIKLRHLDPPTV
jgi:hypothetical protein